MTRQDRPTYGDGYHLSPDQRAAIDGIADGLRPQLRERFLSAVASRPQAKRDAAGWLSDAAISKIIDACLREIGVTA